MPGEKKQGEIERWLWCDVMLLHINDGKQEEVKRRAKQVRMLEVGGVEAEVGSIVDACHLVTFTFDNKNRTLIQISSNGTCVHCGLSPGQPAW